MKRYIEWIAGLGLAVVCLSATGCSGSDVPDPESDSQAAGDSAPDAAAPAALAPPAAPEKVEEPVAAQAEEPSTPPVSAENPATAPDEPPQDAAAEPTPKADPGSASATSEMLAIATAPPSPAGDSGAAAPTDTAPAPGSPEAEAGAAMPPGPPGTTSSESSNAPADPSSTPADPSATNDPGTPGGPPETGSNAIGGDGTPGASGKPAEFRYPVDAVNSFLEALKQRDADLLAEATALRAPTESHVNNRKLFTAILDHSLSDDEFDDLIEKLSGYRISFANAAKSSGRQGIVLEKIVDRHVYRRTIEVRREKAGWKVVDVSGESDLSSSVSGVRSKPRSKK